MRSAIWKRVRELFERLGEVPVERRRAWLERECSDEPEVLAELERLTAADADTSGWLSEHGEVGWLSPGPVAPLQPGDRVGPYRVRSLLGSGGMGAVYCAEQERPRRLVALKTLRADVAGDDLLRRFRTEAEVLGHLRHPGIAHIHDAGTHEDGESRVPYLAMEYVEGARDLVSYANEAGLGERERLELFLAVCEAVHHGHQKGVIHRDLKPGNVLVDAEGRPKVIDFGLARAVHPEALEVSVVQTRAGEILGTLAYMSPEHVSGRTFDVDVRSDVYSLGCLLCELVSGTPPRALDDLPLPAAVRAIAEEEVALEGRVSGELRWILEKALARDPERRYASAAALGDDVRRRLSSEPVVAGPPSTIYRLGRFARRNRALLLGAAAVLLALSVGLYRARLEARSAKRAGEQFERQAAVARAVSFFLVDLFQGVADYRQGREARVVDALLLAESRLPSLDDPGVRAVLTGIVGDGFMKMDELDRAEPHIAEAVRVLREAAPADDLYRLRTEVLYADLLEQRQRLDESRELSEQLLPRLERTLGPSNEITQYLRYNLAVCCQRVGDWGRAEELYRVNLSLIEAFDGGPGKSLAYMDLLHKVGVSRGELGDYDEAVRVLQECLRLTDALPDVAPLYAATFRMDMANVHSNRGDEARALELYLEVEESYARLRPTASNRYAIASNLAGSLIASGRTEEAAQRLERAREVLEANWREPGVRHVDALRLEAELALAEGEPEYAEALAHEALELARRILPETSPMPGHCGDLVARALLVQGRAAAAVDVAREAHESMAAASGARHRNTLATLQTQVEALKAQGELERARARAQELVQATPEGDPRLAGRLALLAALDGE